MFYKVTIYSRNGERMNLSFLDEEQARAAAELNIVADNVIQVTIEDPAGEVIYNVRER